LLDLVPNDLKPSQLVRNLADALFDEQMNLLKNVTGIASDLSIPSGAVVTVMDASENYVSVVT